MNIKEQIIAEIERLKNELIWGACAAQIEMETNCKAEAYDEVLAFINSLPSDEPSEDLEKEISGMYQALFGTDIINRKEMVYLDTFELIARHFAEWQKAQDIKEFLQKPTRTRYKTREECYEQGKKDMREQMMKDAVEGTISCKNLNRFIFVPQLDESLTYGDKVKIIIVKED